MIFRQRSSGVSLSEAQIFSAEQHKLCCVNGTILGREVVPEVYRTRAISPGFSG